MNEVNMFPESDLPTLKNASDHLAAGEGMVYLKCVFIKKGTNAQEAVANANGVILLGARHKISDYLLDQLGPVLKQYGKQIDGEQNDKF